MSTATHYHTDGISPVSLIKKNSVDVTRVNRVAIMYVIGPIKVPGDVSLIPSSDI